MRSICIKTNTPQIITYISNEIAQLKCEEIQYSINTFSNYDNIILHYSGKDISLFIQTISHILSFTVIDEFEENIFIQLLNRHYCYFGKNEISTILSNCFSVLADDFNELFNKKFNLLQNSFSEYLLENKAIILDGFVTFRLKEYFNVLDTILTEAINIFLIEKEYTDFVSLLREYISEELPLYDIIHLVYSPEDNSISLFDDNYNILPVNKDIQNIKYLSDISFSTNDLVLNTLLSNIPKKLIIHVPNGGINEFISTLILIFNTRTSICSNCKLCCKTNSLHLN